MVKRITYLVGLLLTVLAVTAAQPQLKTMQVTCDPYPLTNYPGGSNAVITVYQSQSLGTVWTPFKPTTFFPATRTNQFFQVVAPNTFRFYATVTIQPYGESDPSTPTLTNIVDLAMVRSTRLSVMKQSNAKAFKLGPKKKTVRPIAESKVGKRDFFDRRRNP